MESALSQTLTTLTSTKLFELSRAKRSFEASREACLKEADAAPNATKRVMALLRGLAKIYNERIEHGDDEDDDEPGDKDRNVVGSVNYCRWRNMMEFLSQAERDASVPHSLVESWEKQALADLNKASVKYSHAEFFGKLVIEWSKEHKNNASEGGAEGPDSSRMYQQRVQEWQNLVFTPKEVDKDAIVKYLDKLFKSSTKGRVALDGLRKSLYWMGREKFEQLDFDQSRLRDITEDLLKESRLPNEKKSLLNEILNNKHVANEVADVLSMRLSRIYEWDWPEESIRVVSPAKDPLYLDEEILDTILLHYVGYMWCTELKQALLWHFSSAAWDKPMDKLSSEERKRREQFLKGIPFSQLLHNKRTDEFKYNYFMSQLPGANKTPAANNTTGARNSNLFGSNCDGQDSDDDSYVDIGGEMGIDDETDADDSKNSFLSDKYRRTGATSVLPLHHKIITEALVADKLHGDFAVIRSDFSRFAPSLPHVTLFTVLKYLGVPSKWLELFDRFLKMPIRWGDNPAIKRRQRGVSVDHLLSVFMGESVMFCLDFAVNQATDSQFLYRTYNDFWFWGNHKSCEKAWRAIEEFASTMGLTISQNKTGSVVMSGRGASTSTSTQLPVGDVKWGLWKLDNERQAFVVDYGHIDNLIDSICTKLSGCKSIFAWIKVWNWYFDVFFPSKFGKPANCLGRDHIDMMVDAYNYIEERLFSKLGSNCKTVTDYLMTRIQSEYAPSHELPTGVLYLPIENGGLGLKNPYVSLFALRNSILKKPKKRIDKACDEDEIEYEAKKARYFGGSGNSYQQSRKLPTSKTSALFGTKRSRAPDAPAAPAPGAPATVGLFGAAAPAPASGAGGLFGGAAPAQAAAQYAAPPTGPAAAAAPAPEVDNEDEPSSRRDKNDGFMPLEEFTRYRESTSQPLCNAYDTLMKIPVELHARETPEIPGVEWYTLSYYNKWIYAMYGPQIVQVFGSVEIVDDRSIPMGVIRLLQNQ